MSHSEHSHLAAEGSTVRRILELLPAADTQIRAAQEAVQQWPGVAAMTYDPVLRRLMLRYDAGHVDLNQIAALLAAHQLQLGGGWWRRWCYGYYRFVDSNIKDNAHHQPQCCHKPAQPRGR